MLKRNVDPAADLLISGAGGSVVASQQVVVAP